jgi:hypothetical protein
MARQRLSTERRPFLGRLFCQKNLPNNTKAYCTQTKDMLGDKSGFGSINHALTGMGTKKNRRSAPGPDEEESST